MPSKSMLHNARNGTEWHDAIQHRGQVADHVDDSPTPTWASE